MTERGNAAPQNDSFFPLSFQASPPVILSAAKNLLPHPRHSVPPIVILSLPPCHSERSEESFLPPKAASQRFFGAKLLRMTEREGTPLPRMTASSPVISRRPPVIPRRPPSFRAAPPLSFQASPTVILSGAKNLFSRPPSSCPSRHPVSPVILSLPSFRAAPHCHSESPPPCHSERSEESFLPPKAASQRFFVAPLLRMTEWGKPPPKMTEWGKPLLRMTERGGTPFPRMTASFPVIPRRPPLSF